MQDRRVKVAVIGAGTAGLTALSVVRRYTDDFVLINGGELGTTCARVGCMPSKVLIQAAEDFHRRHVLGRCGIKGGEDLRIDHAAVMEHVRDLRDIFVDRVLGSSTDNFNSNELIEGYARFLEPTLLEVNGQRIHAEAVIIATGSRPFIPAAWDEFREHILTTDELFEQEELPAAAAVVGLGVIGLEVGQSLHRMGVQTTGIDQLDFIGGLTDPEVNRAAVDLLRKEFPLWLGQPAEISAAEDGRLRVSAGDNSVVVDKVLASMGRVPNVEHLELGCLGVPLNAAGIPEYNPHTMQVGDLPVYLAGDVNAARPILHEAGHEGRVAGYNAVHGTARAFKRKTPLAITFCDPNIAMVGMPWEALRERDDVVTGEIPFAVVGRALMMGKNKGLMRIYAEKTRGTVLGAAMIVPKGENLAHLLAWAIEQDLTVADLLRMPFYHPVIEEGMQAVLYNTYNKLGLKSDVPVELREIV